MSNFLTEFAHQLFITLQSFSFFLLIGFVVASFLRLFIKPATIQKLLGKRNFYSVFMASLIGVPMPLCSCSVIPVAISLRKSGASDGATLSFLTSTPVTGVDSIAISFALLPPQLAIARPIIAFVLGIITGLCQIIFFKDQTKPFSIALHLEKKPFLENIKEAIRYTLGDLFPSLANSLFWGIILSGLLLTLMALKILPDLSQISTGYLLADMFVMVLIGVPVYVCATGSTPIVAALIAGGMSPGLAFVFLVSGPATNVTTILAVNSNFRLRSTILYLFVIIAGSITTGLLLDTYWPATPLKATDATHQHDAYNIWDKIAAIILAFWFVYHYGQKLRLKFSRQKITEQSIDVSLQINKMVCQNCVRKITTVCVENNIQVNKIDIPTHTATFTLPTLNSLAVLKSKLSAIGFEATDIIKKDCCEKNTCH